VNIKRVTKSQKSSFNKSAVHPLQTWEWGEFRKEHGNKVIRLAGFESLQDQKNKFYVSYQIIFSKIPKTKYTIGTLIRGPKPTKLTLDVLKKLAKEENAIFIKLEPSFAKATEGQAKFSKITKLLKENGCVPGKRFLHQPHFG
jgi:lipid II:glycine glycyltransferase (peptidoglycan interpeptide bridge formation enzyme)